MPGMISPPRYPTTSHEEPQDPMRTVARAIIHAMPFHRRAPCSAATSCSSTSTLAVDEHTRLLHPSAIRSAAHAVRSYGSTLFHHRSESRKAELLLSISRPICQEQVMGSWAEERPQVQEGKKEGEGHGQSRTSIYSTPSWAGETEDEVSQIGPFEYEEAFTRTMVPQNRASILSFTSSERSYAFF